MGLEPLNTGGECAFEPGFGLGVRQISTNREAMRASFKVLPLVSRSEVLEYLIGLSLGLVGEGGIVRASIKQKGCLGLRDVFL